MLYFSSASRQKIWQKHLYSGLWISTLSKSQSQRSSQRCGFSISSSGDTELFHTHRLFSCSTKARKDGQSINASMKRPYSALSEPRAPLAAVQDIGSRDNIPGDQTDKPAKRTVPWKQKTSSPQSTNNATQQWSHRLYKTKEGKPIMVHYCNSLATAEKVAKFFVNEPILGFDMEWKFPASAHDTIQDNVSVIQFASRDRIAIFHVARFHPCLKLEDLVSPTMKSIMENPNITKTGVNIRGDCTRLRKYLGIQSRGTFELSHLFKLIKYCYTIPKLINKYRVKLAEQVEVHFGLPLSKETEVRCSDWRKPITAQQAHCMIRFP